jgi:hypothetical protein
MFVHIVVLLAVLAVLSSARLHAHEVNEVEFENKELAAKLVAQLDKQTAASAKNLSSKRSKLVASNKDSKTKSLSKAALTDTVSDGYYVMSSKPNSDCTGMSTQVMALKLGTCIDGSYKMHCTSDSDSVTVHYEGFSGAGCTGASSTNAQDVSRCALDTDSYDFGQGLRKIRSRCVPTADLPIPSAGVKVVQYSDDECTETMMYQFMPFGSCEMVQEDEGNMFFYIKFTGVSSDSKRKFSIYSDANCVHKKGGYTDTEAINPACYGPDGDGWYTKIFVTSS